jgi:hypothetical protein
MIINSCFSHNQLPEEMRKLTERGNIYYSEDYFQYLFRIKTHQGIRSQPVYLYSQKFILLVNLHFKYIFKFASLPVEYISIDGDNPADGSLFLDACMEYMKQMFHIQWTGASIASAMFSAFPFNSLRIPFGSYIIDLTEPQDSIWSKIHKKHRNSILKASKSETDIEIGSHELLDDYMLLDAQTWERSSRAGSNKSVFYQLLTSLKNNSLIFLAKKTGIPQGGAIFIYNELMAYCLYSATKNDPERGSINLIHWQAILYMKNLEVKKYNFVGCRINEDPDSKYHTLQRFKERFGGQLITGYMFKVVFNKTIYFIFNLFLYLRGNKPIDPVVEEIHKWSDLNR